MRPLVAVGLCLMLAGCSSPEAPADAAADPLAGEPTVEAAPRANATFSGTWTTVTSHRTPAGVQTDYFRDGDLAVKVESDASSVRVVGELDNAVPATWQMCLSQGDPLGGFCTEGTSPIELVVEGDELRSGDWDVAFFVSGGPAAVGAATEIRWSADVAYA